MAKSKRAGIGEQLVSAAKLPFALYGAEQAKTRKENVEIRYADARMRRAIRNVEEMRKQREKRR